MPIKLMNLLPIMNRLITAITVYLELYIHSLYTLNGYHMRYGLHSKKKESSKIQKTRVHSKREFKSVNCSVLFMIVLYLVHSIDSFKLCLFICFHSSGIATSRSAGSVPRNQGWKIN